MRAFFSLVGKLCVSSIFIFTSLQDLLQWTVKEQVLYDRLSMSLHSLSGAGMMSDLVHSCMQNIEILFGFAIFVKLLGGVLVAFSWKEKLGALLLLLYLFPYTLLFHDFWNHQGDALGKALEMFGLYVAAAGGLFLILSLNGGASTSDSKKSTKN